MKNELMRAAALIPTKPMAEINAKLNAELRRWSILLTSANHGTVGPLGSTFPHAGEHHERVVVVEVPAAAGAPVDQVNLQLVTVADRQAAVERALKAAQAWANEEYFCARNLGKGGPGTHATCDAKQAACIAAIRALDAPVAAQAGQVAVPEGFALMPRRLTAENGAKSLLIGEFSESTRVKCHECDGSGEDSEYDSGCVECGGEGTIEQKVAVEWDTIKRIYDMAVQHLAAAPSAPAEAQQAPMAVDGVRWDLFPGYLIDHCEGDVLSEEGLQSALAGMLKDPQYLAAAAAQASTAGERQEGGDRG